MRCTRPLRLVGWLLASGLLALGGGASAEAREGGPGPGKPLWPLPGQKDYVLYEKAVRIQSRMWWHLSPDGLYLEFHRAGANAEELQHDVLLLGDAAIWTGCYAASQAARWHVTGDPDALAQCKHLAKGLAALTDVTGVEGCFARNVGRILPDETLEVKALHASTAMPGYHFRCDISRDQLAGVMLGWRYLGRFVDDPEVQRLAKLHSRRIAMRLYDHGMWLRDHNGGKTEFGELRKDVEYLTFVDNGPLAAIGLATLVAARDLSPDSSDLYYRLRGLTRAGWHLALDEQHTFIPDLVNPSNVNMVALALATLAFHEEEHIRRRTHAAIHKLRSATRGWWNAGLCACWLASGITGRERVECLGEVRRTLHDMTEEEIFPQGGLTRSLGRIATIKERGGETGWAWKESVRGMREYPRGETRMRDIAFARGDWLFAYWLSRLMGDLTPRIGPGKDPKASRIAMDMPPWMASATPSPGAGPEGAAPFFPPAAGDE